MIEINFEGQLIEAKTKENLAVILRREPYQLSCERIGNILGYSEKRVRNLLEKNNLYFSISYRGKRLEVSTKEEMVVLLRKYPYRCTYEEIGYLVGFSREWVGKILIRYNLNGDLSYPELDDKQLYGLMSDEDIAQKLNVRKFTVVQARKKLFLDKKKTVRLDRRRIELIRILFGVQMLPGVNFSNWLLDLCNDLTPRYKELIDDFYIQGAHESLSKNINSDSNRVARWKARNKIKLMLKNVTVNELIEKDVLHDPNHPES